MKEHHSLRKMWGTEAASSLRFSVDLLTPNQHNGTRVVSMCLALV